MSPGSIVDEDVEDLYENAPCGHLTSRVDGTIVRINRTFERWIGFHRTELVNEKRLQDLLAPGDRIYHETHYAPLLQMQGSISEIAVEFVKADGSRLPALLNSVMRTDPSGSSRVIRTAVFEASDRRRYERELLRARREEHETAVRLQRGLLSRSLPSFDGLELEIAYRPGKRGTEVGGDWYDAFRAGGTDEVMLVVGDVVGHGIGAASEMGQLRSAVRAFGATGLGPAALLEALDRYSDLHRVGRMATLACAQLDPRSGRLRYACAGHLPPVIDAPGARPAFAWDGRSAPLFAPMAEKARNEAVCQLPPGSMLLMYTDGLVERRDRGIDIGMEELLQHISRHRDKSPAVVVAELIRALHDPTQRDDVCLLLAKMSRG
jgi:PAS domain S-box-containing protein